MIRKTGFFYPAGAFLLRRKRRVYPPSGGSDSMFGPSPGGFFLFPRRRFLKENQQNGGIKVKTPYQSANGKTAGIKVNPAVAEALACFEREDGNAARKARWRGEVSLDALYEETEWEPQDTTVDIEAGYIAKEEREALCAAVAGLPPKQRRLVLLYYCEEKTVEEIGLIFGVSHQAVSKQLSTIHRALKKNFF